MANTKLGTLASEYEFSTMVSRMDIYFDEITKEKQAINGQLLYGHQGYRLKAILEWSGDNYIDDTQYENLRHEFNKNNASATAELNFIPNPDDYSNSNFKVRWIGGFNFRIMAGVAGLKKYQGTIELIGNEILSSVPEWT